MSRSVIKSFSFSLCIASLAFIFSLLGSPNSYAYRWDIADIPVSSQSILSYNNPLRNPFLRFKYRSDSGVSSSDFKNLDSFKFFTSHYNSLSGKCEYSPNWYAPDSAVQSHDSYQSFPDFLNNEFTFGFPSVYSALSNFHTTEPGYISGICRQDTFFGGRHPLSPVQGMNTSFYPMPEFDESSLVNIPPIDRFSYSPLLPYWFAFDTLHMVDHKTFDGVDFDSVLHLSDIFGGDVVSGFYEMEIPLGYSALDFNASGQVEVRGTFDFEQDPGYHSDEFLLITQQGKKVSTNDYDTFPLGYYVTFDYRESHNCDVSFDYEHNDLIFSCKYLTDSLISSKLAQGTYNISLLVRNTSNTDYSAIFANDVDFVFRDFMIITDGDDTYKDPDHKFWGSHFNQGMRSSDAPGTIDIDSTIDWYGSIIGMFNFNLFNPFLPIFNMFTTGGDCVSIPTIAGMLGSEETTYCPWFDSTTRNIVTPIVSIFSVMLVFGFVLRWLGSSSGNYLEDSDGVSTNHYHFESRYHGKWRKNK